MKIFDVHFNDEKAVQVAATHYTHVFWRNDADVQWFRDDAVIGITENLPHWIFVA